MNSRLPKRSTVPGWKGRWRLPIWSLTGSCSSTRSRPLPGAPTVGVLGPGGVPGPTSEMSPRAPAQMGRRETEREGGKKRQPERERERWKSCGLRVRPAPRSGALAVGGYKRPRGRGSERPHASACPVLFPARPTLCKRALVLPFIGVRRGSRCTMGGVAEC
jgi:hypothetical protein